MQHWQKHLLIILAMATFVSLLPSQASASLELSDTELLQLEDASSEGLGKMRAGAPDDRANLDEQELESLKMATVANPELLLMRGTGGYAGEGIGLLFLVWGIILLVVVGGIVVAIILLA